LSYTGYLSLRLRQKASRISPILNGASAPAARSCVEHFRGPLRAILISFDVVRLNKAGPLMRSNLVAGQFLRIARFEQDFSSLLPLRLLCTAIIEIVRRLRANSFDEFRPRISRISRIEETESVLSAQSVVEAPGLQVCRAVSRRPFWRAAFGCGSAALRQCCE